MNPSAGARTAVRAVCPHDCPDTCAMVVTVENGRAIRVRGDPDHPSTQGVLCTKVSRYLERTYSPDRLLHPMRRNGPKGPGRGAWQRIGWDEALDLVAGRLRAVCDDDPQGVMPYAYSGTLGLVQNFGLPRRFFRRLGATVPERTLCATAGRRGYTSVVGAMIGTDIEHFDESELIVLWGTNPVASNLHLWTRIQEARRRGARIVAIDPYRSLSAERSDLHLAIRPGTDAALAFGLMHVLFAEGRIDRDYVARHTVGVELLAGRAAQYPPSRVAELCGLGADDVLRLAREYAATRRAAIRVNFGLQRHAGGGNAVRAIACLPALTGAWREPSGGVLLDQSGAHAIDLDTLDGTRAMPAGATLPRSVNMARLGRALLELDDPPIRALVVYNANPVASAPDTERVRRGLLRPDLFTVVHELFLTDTCDYADVVLPATSQLEQFDVHRPYGTLYTMLNRPAIAPLGEAVSNGELFRRLAARMGFDEPWLAASDEDVAREAFARDAPVNATLDMATLERDGWRRLDLPARHAPFADGGFPTPSGRCEFWSELAHERGEGGLPDFIPPRESALADPERARRFPLMLLSPPARLQLNSSFSAIASIERDTGEARVDIAADDAHARGIEDGDRVRLFNDRGAFEVIARVGDRVRPGVLVVPSIWWPKRAADGRNVNAVTSDALTDLGAGACYYDTAVQLERVAAAGRSAG